jgi:hypothetical protein
MPWNKQCRHCKKWFGTTRKQQNYCSTACRKTSYASSNPFHASDLSSSTRGAIAELVVAIDLMANGYEVFRALSPSSGCDLLAIRGDALRKLEVRTGSRTTRGVLSFSRVVHRHATEFAVYEPATKQITYLPTGGTE